MTNTVTGFFPELWSRELKRVFDKVTVMGGLVNTDYEGLITNFGDVVHIQIPGNITVSNYTREQDITYNTLTSVDDTLLIDQAKFFAFLVDDLDKAQADVNIIETYTQRAGMAIRETVDSAILAHYVDADAANYIGTDALPKDLSDTTNNDIYKLLVDLGVLLDDKNVPAEGRWFVCPPRVAGVIRKNTLFSQANTSGDGGTLRRTGFIGEVAGFEIYITSNITAVDNDSSATTPSVFNCLGGTRDAISFASQVAKVETIRMQTKFADAIRGLFLYGKKVLQNDCLAVLKANSTTI